jgi:hypothetical protein
LAQDAARETFVDIADDIYGNQEVDKILLLTDNMPLAIYLVAHLVESEGCSSVLSRWEETKTSMLSEGYDKMSNLHLSISLSLFSPRIAAVPHSKDLLSLLSMLPDGLSDAELRQSRIPIDDILRCKAALLRTSLAYNDNQGRLNSLVPVREYMHKLHPPAPHIVRPLLKYYHQLLEVYQVNRGTMSHPGVSVRITANFANIQNILLNSLNQGNPDLVDTIYCTSYLDMFSAGSGRGHITFMNLIPNVLPRPSDHRLEAYIIMKFLNSWRFHPIPDSEGLIDQAQEHFKHFDDPDLQCMFFILVFLIIKLTVH